jgi:hypothetical protein
MKLMCSLAVVAAAGLMLSGCQMNEGTPGVDRTDSRVANQVPAARQGAGDSAGQVISPQERERVDRIRNGQYEARPRDGGAVNATDSGVAPRDNVSGVGGSGVGNSSADPRGTNPGNSGTTGTPDRTAPAGR